MNLSQGSKSLIDLVKGAYKGEVMLPDFQRNFVWSRGDVEELFKSLLENMFIGNFLIHNVDPLNPPFKPIAIEGAKMVNKNFKEKPSILILDGQQRLSSTFYAFYSPDIPLRNASYPYAFFIRIQSLLSDDIENSVFSSSKTSRWFWNLLNEDGSYNIEKLKESEIIPLTTLVKDFTSFWYKNFERNYTEEQGEKVRNLIKKIENYNVLTLDVPLSEKPENIAVLFERINRTGLKLSIFDLLVARLYKYINLREQWETAFDERENISKYAQHNKRDTSIPYYFIQALALSKGFSIKARDMLKLDEKILNKSNWDELIKVANEKVLLRLLDINEYGVARVDRWSPYSTMLVPFLAFVFSGSKEYKKINQWYWASIFTERYGGSTDSTITKDFREVVKWFDDDESVPEVVSDFRKNIRTTFTLLDKNNSGNSIYKGVFNLLFKNDACDFYEVDKIKFSKYDLDDHHIFPFKFLELRGITQNVNSILNRTLIYGSTNKSILKKAPGDYINKMVEIHKTEDEVKKILRLHFIDEKMYELMKCVKEETPPEEIEAKFNQFMTWRAELIITEINRLINQ